MTSDPDYYDALDARDREREIMSTFPEPAPAPTEGQLSTEGYELVALTDLQRRWWPPCCDQALRIKPQQCVCAFETVCPDHGRRHNGTHD